MMSGKLRWSERVKSAVATLPPVPSGLRRLLRVEASFKAPLSDWLAQALDESGASEAMGRWFVLDPGLLAFYAEDAGLGAPRISYLDVCLAEMEGWRVSRVKERLAGRLPASFSKDPENEYFVPQDLARSRVAGPLL